MKRNKTKGKPMVTSVSSHIKKTTYNNGSQVTTKEETIKRKQGFLGMLDAVGEQIMQNIQDGKIELTSTMDIERLIKLTLLVSGEADSIRGKADSTESGTGVESDAKLSMSQIEKILSLDDPEVQKMYDKLYQGYNEINDQED